MAGDSGASVVTMSVLRRLVGFTFKVLSLDGCWDVLQRQYPTQESPSSTLQPRRRLPY
jgi:hypothetical protein